MALSILALACLSTLLSAEATVLIKVSSVPFSEIQKSRNFELSNVELLYINTNNENTPPSTLKIELLTNRGDQVVLNPSEFDLGLSTNEKDVYKAFFNVSVSVTGELPLGDVGVTARCGVCDVSEKPTTIIQEDRRLIVGVLGELSSDLKSVSVSVSKSLALDHNLPLDITVTDRQGNTVGSQEVVLEAAADTSHPVTFPTLKTGAYLVSVACPENGCGPIGKWVEFGAPASLVVTQPSITMEDLNQQLKELLEKQHNLNVACKKLGCVNGDCSADSSSCECWDLWTGETCVESSEPVCPPAAQVAHATITYTLDDKPSDLLLEGTMAKYSCDNGYHLKDNNNNNIICSGEEFIGETPSCIADTPAIKPSPSVSTTEPTASGNGAASGEASKVSVSPQPSNIPVTTEVKLTTTEGDPGTTEGDPTTTEGDPTTTENYSTEPPTKPDESVDEPDKSVDEPDKSVDEPDKSSAATPSFLGSHTMEVSVGCLIMLLVLALGGYLVYHYRSKVTEVVCGERKASLPWLRTKSPSGGSGRYTKLPRTMQEALHQD